MEKICYFFSYKNQVFILYAQCGPKSDVYTVKYIECRYFFLRVNTGTHVMGGRFHRLKGVI